MNCFHLMIYTVLENTDSELGKDHEELWVLLLSKLFLINKLAHILD